MVVPLLLGWEAKGAACLGTEPNSTTENDRHSRRCDAVARANHPHDSAVQWKWRNVPGIFVGRPRTPHDVAVPS